MKKEIYIDNASELYKQTKERVLRTMRRSAAQRRLTSPPTHTRGLWLQSSSLSGERTYIYRYSYEIVGKHGRWIVSFNLNRDTELQTGALPPPSLRHRPNRVIGTATILEEAKNLADEDIER
jgi:hypothetical protein